MYVYSQRYLLKFVKIIKNIVNSWIHGCKLKNSKNLKSELGVQGAAKAPGGSRDREAPGNS
jgi:hypothetical protein